MHELKIHVNVKGKLTEPQMASLASDLYTAVHDYLGHLPMVETPLVINMDNLFDKVVPLIK